MPPSRFVEMFTRSGRRGRAVDDEGGDRRAAAAANEATPHWQAAHRPASAGAMPPPSLTSSGVALISCDGTADGVAPERSDAEMGLTTGFTPRRRLASADDRRRRAGSAGTELGIRKYELGGEQKPQQHHRHASFLPHPPLPARLRRRTSTANGGGSGINTPHSRRDSDDDNLSSSTSPHHSTLAVDATAADVPPADPAPPKPPSLLKAVPQWWRVAILWFKSPSRWRALAWSGAAIGLSLGVTMMYVEISYIQSSFMTALSGKDAPGFKRAVLRYAGIIAAAAPLFALSDWVEKRLKLAWRAWLASRLMGDYFGNAAFYRLHLVTAADCAAGDDPAAAVAATVDNPDQRICDDVAEFAESSVALAIGVVGKVFQMAAFSGVLWSKMPKLVGFIFGYAFLGTLIAASIFGRKLAHLTFATLRREGDLRFDLVRTRENAEAIAFYGGGSRERRTAHHKLDKLVKVRRSAILWSAGLSLWTHAYSYATILVPSVMCAPLYFSGKMQFGVISQVTTSFNHIEAALNFLVNHLARVSALAAVSARLETLQDALVHARGSGPKIGRETEVRGEEGGAGFGNDGKEAAAAAPTPPPPPQTILRLSSLTVCTPAGGRTLTTSLDLELRAGQSLLIVGPSGCGKSSLLRAVAGLWSRGGGVVAAPHPRRCFFLPQKPYMPLGPLRDQLIFPADSKGLARAAAEASRREHASSLPLAAAARAAATAIAPGTTAPTTRATDDGSYPTVDPSLADDSKLLDLLDAVALPQLAGAVGGLDADVEWGHVLSLGEQQRVAAARLLAARPSLAFLDEATSAMDAASEAHIYAAVAQTCRHGCYVSVGHRPELARYHSHVLESAGEGRWRLLHAREWREEGEGAGRGGAGRGMGGRGGVWWGQAVKSEKERDSGGREERERETGRERDFLVGKYSRGEGN